MGQYMTTLQAREPAAFEVALLSKFRLMNELKKGKQVVLDIQGVVVTVHLMDRYVRWHIAQPS